LDAAVAADVVSGIADGCKDAGCALLGGETAEMPGMYADGDYDLAGFCVGAVERGRILDSSRVRSGDVLVGLPSSGIHSNGYSLARKALLGELGLSLEDDVPECDGRLADVLLTPTRIYAKATVALLGDHFDSVHGAAHITGGGLIENIPRVLPDELEARLDYGSWEEPAIFNLIRSAGVDEEEMRRTFNLGVGFVFVVEKAAVDSVVERLRSVGEKPSVIGTVGAIG
jgi:phosphoribosylformylglycinamidine cyclo-ligase